jgi:CPA2 family monovalent cation:H+ antiporter-2
MFLASLAPTLWHMQWQTALALSGALAMSSTAIVIKMMVDRIELDSDHGKRVVGVLLFQDLAVVPLLVLIPALGAPPEKMAIALVLAAVKATLLITLLLTGGQRLMHWWLMLVARRQSQELFMLNILLTTLGFVFHHHWHDAGLANCLGPLGIRVAVGHGTRGIQVRSNRFAYTSHWRQ